MTSYVDRDGRLVPADEVFAAWTSGDLGRMLRARYLKANNTDRHFLLMNIVRGLYAQRVESGARKLFLEIGRQHVAEFPRLAASVKQGLRVMPRVPTYALLATALTEDGLFDEALSVCKQAIDLGLHDGTKSDFSGRRERIRKAMKKGGQ